MTHPWSVPVAVAQIPDEGLHVELEAGAGERQALAALGGLRDVTSARASFDLRSRADGTVQVRGRLDAVVGQTCVVTLDPIDSTVGEAIDVLFAPPEQVPALAAAAAKDDDGETADPPEPIERGVIDLGHVAADALFLGLDPYPRKPGAIFDVPETPPDPQDHPFAALGRLRQKDDSGGGESR